MGYGLITSLYRYKHKKPIVNNSKFKLNLLIILINIKNNYLF